MKKMLLNFADNLLSKEEQSKVKGGCGGGGSCGVCTDSSSAGPWGPQVSSCDSITTPWGDNYCICNTGGACEYLA